MTSAIDIIKGIESHCNETIASKRLRFHMIETLQREIDKRVHLESRISAVLDGAETFDPKTHKSIRAAGA